MIEAQHGGVADGGQSSLSHDFAYHQHIHHIVEGLQQVGQKQRKGELNQFFFGTLPVNKSCPWVI